MDEKIEPFNAQSKCPKCSGEEVKTHYCKGVYFSWECRSGKGGEHLHRVCNRCHYEWLQAVIPVEPIEEKP